jgi:hypothetical protein
MEQFDFTLKDKLEVLHKFSAQQLMAIKNKKYNIGSRFLLSSEPQTTDCGVRGS